MRETRVPTVPTLAPTTTPSLSAPMTARVTSGYAFALLALDLTWTTTPRRVVRGEEGRRGAHLAVVALGVDVVVVVFADGTRDAVRFRG